MVLMEHTKEEGERVRMLPEVRDNRGNLHAPYNLEGDQRVGKITLASAHELHPPLLHGKNDTDATPSELGPGIVLSHGGALLPNHGSRTFCNFHPQAN